MAVLSKLKPAGFVSRYKRYKAGTAQVVSWLAPRFLFRSSSKDLETIRIKTRELRKLAEVITDSDPPVQVPAALIQVLDDVIAGREECASWYAAQAIDDATKLAAQNETHAHFIGILKEVRELLRKNAEQATEAPRVVKKSKKNKKANSTIERVANFFDHLDLEEPSASPLGDGPPPPYVEGQDASPPDRFTDAKFEMENTGESDAFALWCYLQDLNDIRSSIKSTWRAYAKGEITLDVAGMVTEVAFGMMKRSHDELITIKPKFSDWWSVAYFLRLKLAFNNNVVYTFSKDPNAKVKQVQEHTNQADLVCTAAALLLRSFREACQMSLTGALKYNRGFGTGQAQDLIGNRAKTDFEPILFSFVPEITVLAASKRMKEKGKVNKSTRHFSSYFTEELTTLIPLNTEPLEPSIWLVVACQTLMDVEELVGHANAVKALSTSASVVKEIVRESIHFHESSRLFKGKQYARTEQLDQARGIASHVCRVAMSTTHGDGTPESHHADQASTATFGDQVFFPGVRSLPHFAGEVSYFMKIRLHGLGVTMANDGHAVLIMAHIYKAAKKYGLVSAAWHDMDLLVALHSSKKPFVTKTSASADAHAMLRHYLLDMGVDATEFANGRIPPSPFDKSRNDKVKKLSSAESEVTSALLEQYRDHEEVKCERGVLLDALLTNIAAKISTTTHSTNRPPRFTPAQLLATFKESLIADEARVNFDYIGLSRFCMDLLEKFLAGVKVPQKDKSHLDAVFRLLKAAADADAKAVDVGTTAFAAIGMLQPAIAEHGKKRPVLNNNTGKISEASITAFMQHLPGASVGSSRRTIEIYHPQGNMQKADWIFNSIPMSPFRRAIMPGGTSKNIHVIVPESDVDMQDLTEGYTRPNLNMNSFGYGPTEDYISKEEAKAWEARAKKRMGMA
ncbi:hypothetical protein LTR56_018521 [Elasticomyces elasticus]|nr:hypothetical protein LTR56_018521 [Elasticomyces elasticus]KAK3636474.1 hypothetical protein LTR22_018707 [Elasticomyces elasticus]